jgi:hypothetical protein
MRLCHHFIHYHLDTPVGTNFTSQKTKPFFNLHFSINTLPATYKDFHFLSFSKTRSTKMNSNDNKNRNFLHSMFKEMLSDDEGCLLVSSVLDGGYTFDEICEFVMRKFLKHIRTNGSFEIKCENVIAVDTKIVDTKINDAIYDTKIVDEFEEPIKPKATKSSKPEYDMD